MHARTIVDQAAMGGTPPPQKKHTARRGDSFVSPRPCARRLALGLAAYSDVRG